MQRGLINKAEYITVSAVVLQMWMDKRLRDSEYYSFMNRLNDYARESAVFMGKEASDNIVRAK